MSDNNRKSFMGSLKSRFGSRRSNDGDRAVSPVSPRAVSPGARGFATPTATTAPTRSSRNPLANPSEPTRRPVNEPPPPYSIVAELPGNSMGAAPVVPPAPAPISFSLRPASPTPSQRSSASVRPTINNVRTAEDPYAFLSMFDTVFLIDDSGSMAGRSWREVHAVLANILPICTQRDADGVDIYFLNHKAAPPPPSAPVQPGKAKGGYYNITDAATVARIFQDVRPGKGTPTGTRLHSILTPYIRSYEMERNAMQQRGDYGDPDPDVIKPVNIIVITDGVPTDDPEDILVTAAKKLDQLEAPPFQVGVQFFRVGNEPGAAEYLEHLDDDLGREVSEGLRDMVDAVTWDARFEVSQNGSVVSSNSSGPNTALGLTADGVLKVVLGAVVKRLDRRPTGPAPPANNPNAHEYLSAPR
ncbi:hypothetical protein SBRCBS47491_004960 [Sporothrix bragantina]|uniref:VWFA domain-containing protein n=1 Tax=Sporothrix bragantina TaxID=671064 RepID=A0ABP0BUC9_9PEZI